MKPCHLLRPLLAAALLSPLATGCWAQQQSPLPDAAALAKLGILSVEAEDPSEHNFVVTAAEPAHATGTTARAFAGFSAGRACLLLAKAPPPQGPYRARYEVKADRDGEFDFWLLENGREWSSPIRWRIGQGPWHDLPATGRMLNARKLADDGPNFAWTPAGRTRLAAGTQTLEIEVTGPRAKGDYLFSADLLLFAPAELATNHSMRPPFSASKEQPPADAIFLHEQDPAPGSDIPDDFRPRLDPFLLGETASPKGAVIVCPGGGYRVRAAHEGAPVAEAFRERGFQAFVLQYRLKPHAYAASAADAARAIRWVRQNAARLRIRPDRIAICGFSAGGHLAAGAGVHHGKPFVNVAGDALETLSARPDAILPIYPWIPGPEWVEKTRAEGGDLAEAELFCLPSFVNSETPPAFFLHAGDDRLGPENSWRFADAMRGAKIPFELHILPSGGHGFGLAERRPYVARWIDWAAQWLDEEAWKGK